MKPPRLLLFHPLRNKETIKQKQYKKKRAVPLIIPLKKRFAVAFAARSSPFLPAGVPSAWCIQQPPARCYINPG
jgi:hypothetical protein